MKRFPLLLLLALSIISCTNKPQELGSRKNPVKLYFTPSVDAENITSNSKEFIQYLEKEMGIYFTAAVPTSYIAVVEAFGSKRADIAVMNSFGYLMANNKYEAQAFLKVIRYGKDYYRGQIIASTKSGIKKLEDINGKKFAYTDASSTSGYMFPKKILQEAGVKPKSTVFAIKHDNVVTMVYQGQVDAGATYYDDPKDGKITDARARVKTQFPDVEEKVKIIKITNKIPNDPFVFRSGFPVKMRAQFITTVKKFLLTEDGKKVFIKLYGITAVADANDSDWDGLRAMIKTIGLNLEDVIGK